MSAIDREAADPELWKRPRYASESTSNKPPHKGVMMIASFKVLLLTVFALIPVSTGAESFVESSSAGDAPTAAALKSAASFHQFLGRGDSANAVRLLASDATILESGGLETRGEYLAHHLGEDIEFAKAVTTTRSVVDAQRRGDVVWVVAMSVSKGRFHDRQIDSRGAELMVLSRSGQRWVIRAIHWSSRRSAL